MMRILMDFDTCDRKFYVFDSFVGLPSLVPQDQSGSGLAGTKGQYAATQEKFEKNLKGVSAWNDSIIVISKGWFNETCAISPVSKISFLRLDGDLFVSTWDALSALYDRVVPSSISTSHCDSFARVSAILPTASVSCPSKRCGGRRGLKAEQNANDLET
mmetsp:Transcript_23586/g.33788  ORF Transcript_23586/g.33788 Transcript_23586/m.33788 type:complete len:159 (-) Transcript_23586:731-1207(-)